MPGNIRAGRMNLRARTVAGYSFTRMPQWHNMVVVAPPVPARGPRRLVRASGFGVALGFAVTTMVVIWFTAPWATTYSGSSLPGATADLARGAGPDAGRVAAAAGVAGKGGQPDRGAGRGRVAGARLGWLAGRSPAGPQHRHGCGAAVLAADVDLLPLPWPQPALPARARSAAARAPYHGSGSQGRRALDPPRLDPHCWSNCTDNSFLLSAQPAIEQGLETAGILLALGLGTGIVAVCAGRLTRGTRTARARLAPVRPPGLLVGGSAAAQAIALLRTPLEGPEFAVFSALFQARAWSVGALAAGLSWTVVRARLTRSRLACGLRAGGCPSSRSAGSRAGQGDE